MTRRAQPFVRASTTTSAAIPSSIGTAMFRFRERDFEALEHEEGVSPAWPIRYAELEPYYAQAERLFGVHGQAGDDPTEPPRSAPYPFPAGSARAVAGRAVRSAFAQWASSRFTCRRRSIFIPADKCVRCGTCDAFPCRVDAKGDAEICLIDPALRHANVTLQTGSLVTRLLTDDSGKRIVAAEARARRRDCSTFTRGCSCCVPARSTAPRCCCARPAPPSSRPGQRRARSGRYYMNHNTTALMTLHAAAGQSTPAFRKRCALNDFYFGGAQATSRSAICRCSARFRNRCCAARCREYLDGCAPSSPATASTGTSCPRTWRITTARCGRCPTAVSS